MDKILKEALGTSLLKRSGRSGGGCINSGQMYETDFGLIFAKFNEKPESRRMFEGEMEGLTAIAETNTIKVPTPMKVIDNPKGGAILVLEYIDMKALSTFSKQLGEELANLHLHNTRLEDKMNTNHVGELTPPCHKFGFHATTCCGYLPQDNTWCDDWVTFFTRQRLGYQLNLIETDFGDREALELWSQLQQQIPNFFKGDKKVYPSLLHGDLWGGNAAETNDGPLIFDPAVFYGHHEYDLAIAGMFGGFNRSFYDAYHKIIPKETGFEVRQKLYQLFHYLNHWNHFGTSYRSSSISTMKFLLKK